MDRRAFVIGNWKMNGLRAALSEIEAVRDGVASRSPAAEVAICPPATLIAAAAAAAGQSALAIGGQDAHPAEKGAHTGDVSAEMLADAGATLAIVGHSERRADHREDDAIVASKLAAAQRAGLTAVLCVGETKEEREAGRTVAVVSQQLAQSTPAGARLDRMVLAYEPVWAIGTGLTPTLDDIAETHAALRAKLVEAHGPEGAATRILYGGSVKPGNAAEILALDDVDGALVGGASLLAADFLAIIDAAA